MRFSGFTLAACAVTAHAFKDTSPFLMFSNKEIPDSLHEISRAQVQSADSVLEAAKGFLSKCEAEKYYIISQPGLTASTLSKSSPHLRNALSDKHTVSTLAVPEVVGLKETHRDELVNFVQSKCKAKISNQFVERARYGPREVASEEWAPMIGGWTESEKKLGRSDPALQANVLKDLALHHGYTFILLSTPGSRPVEAEVDDDPVYEAAFSDVLHMDLKRNLYARGKNLTAPSDQRPLFEKYQFLTPGLFMGLLVGFILISILSVGLSAIASLKVSYGAFEKEMGPSAQKKSQ